MDPETESRRTVTLVGRAREQYDKISSDRYRLCLMEISHPYPHVVYFLIEAKDGCGIAEIVGKMEDAEEVMIVFDVQPANDGFDEVSPALETSVDRITIVKPGKPDLDY